MDNNRHRNSLQGILLTPPGFGGIALVRVSGEHYHDLGSKLFVSIGKVAFQDMESHHVYLGDICEADQVVDQVMVVIDRDKGFFDIHCHGGPRIVQRLLILLEKMGAEIILWHDMDIEDSIDAEVEFYLSYCKSELAVKTIASQISQGLAKWCDDSLSMIDSDQAVLSELCTQASEIFKTREIARQLLCPPKVFIVGPPNAGKSSLANVVTGRSQSLVSEIPGTTRDWTSEFTELAGIAVELIDTAGRRETDDHLESISLQLLTGIISHAELFILLMPSDYADSIDTLYREQLEALPENANLITVMSKSDMATDESIIEFADMSISAMSREGVQELKQLIASRLGFGEDFDYSLPLIFTDRQQELFSQASNCSNLQELKAVINKVKG